MGRAAQQELLLPRKLIIFNPGRRKERGEGEGLREKRRGWQRRGEDGRGEERMAEERRGWGRGEGKEREAEQERGAREGKAGRDCSQRRGQWEWGKPAGSLGGDWMWRGHVTPLLNPSGSSPRPGLGAGMLLWDPPQATQPGQKAAPSWVSPTQGCVGHRG